MARSVSQSSSYDSMEYSTLAPLPQGPRQSPSSSAHSRHFHAFRHPLFIKHPSPITHIHFNPARPHRYAVSSATRVLIYAPKTGKVVKTVSRFKDVARCAEFRRDGKLLVAGCDDGLVQVFDVGSRAVLRTMTGHRQPVHVTHFSPHSLHILSAADDTTARLWDIATQTCVSSFEGHTDYVRSAVFHPSSPDLVLTASYDSTIRLHDRRLPAHSANTLTMRHGGVPVEDVLVFPSGGVAVSVGGPIMRVWDIAMGGRCERALSNHQKTITSVTLDASSRRVMTGSLDSMVKVYDVDTLKVVHTMRYPAPLLSLAVSPDDTHIVAGLSDGTLSVRRRDPKTSEAAISEAQERKLASGSYEYFADMEAVFGTGHIRPRGKDVPKSLAAIDEHRVQTRRARRLKEFDRYLKAFKFGAALDASLKKVVRPSTTFALLHELVQRDALRVALVGRDDVRLEPLTTFLVRHVTDPRFGALAVDVFGVVLDLYTPILGYSTLLDQVLARLHSRIERELSFQSDLTKLRGALDMTLAQAAIAQLHV